MYYFLPNGCAMSEPSKIFSGYRVLGYISNHVPLAVRHHQKRKENYVVTCVGKAFHTYNCSRLGIVSVSDAHPCEISCLAVDAKFVYTGCGKQIQAFVRGKKVIHTYEGHDAEVEFLLPFGKHLISVDAKSNVKVWDINSEGLYLEMSFDSSSLKITAIMHPHSYKNKILFGTKTGFMQLWNIRTDKMIHLFQGWSQPITTIVQSPAIDVVAVGLQDGQILLHNLKFDETLMRFCQDWGPVTTLSFRTDDHPIMVTGSALGHITLWDLEERRLKCQMRNAHSSSITGMECLPSEPLMVTSSGDNSLKVWIFDQPDGAGRLLRQREGHSAPPNNVCHYGSNGQNIISAGQDSTFHSFSTVHEKHNKSLGRASFNKMKTKKSGLRYDQHMMPPIVQFATESCRESDWDNILACHRGLSEVTTWSYQRSTMGNHRLQHKRFSKPDLQTSVATCVDITLCGNFGLIGYSSGHVDQYNLESGVFRGSFGTETAHNCAVRGIAVDGLKQVAVTAGADGTLKFWRFKEKELLASLELGIGISQIQLHRESAMLAVVLDDFAVFIVDLETRRIVRKFLGHSNTVTDLTFSPDARWLISASMDRTLRTWNLPMGKLIDCFLVEEAVTSLSMSPTGDFLATSHVDDLGVYLWSNMTLWKYVSLNPLPEDFEPQLMQMPGSGSQNEGEKEAEEDMDTGVAEAEFKSPEQISDELITLALLSNSRWLNLLNLDVIKKRNKPKEPPKKPKSAPFFLPTIPGLEPKFAIPEGGSPAEHSRCLGRPHFQTPQSNFGQVLLASAEKNNLEEVFENLKMMGPSATEVEMHLLAPLTGGSVELMSQFLKVLGHVLSIRTDFQLAQAYLGLFLKLHGDVIASEPVLVEQMEEVAKQTEGSWDRLQDLFNQSLCLTNYLRSAGLS